MAQTVKGICVIKHPRAEAEDDPEVVGVVPEGIQVLQGLKDAKGHHKCLRPTFWTDLRPESKLCERPEVHF